VIPLRRRYGSKTREAAVDASDTTRDRIRAVAVELFTERGYEKTSLREIADRVGITKASLYYHYPSKQTLLLAIMEPFLADWSATMDAAERLSRTPENVRFVLEREIDAMLRHQAATAMLLRDVAAVFTALAPKLEEIKQLGDRMHTWLAGPDPAPEELIRAMAAVEVLRTTLAAAARPELPEAEVRRVVLDAAARVLGLGEPDVAPRDREVAAAS
jgi:AcrR family transcriptional regulator